jgi:dihydroxyacid dehydratase/phosphogluconate dehydratase
VWPADCRDGLEDLKPADLLTVASFDNAITVDMAIGGSTTRSFTSWRWRGEPESGYRWNDLTRSHSGLRCLADHQATQWQYLMEDLLLWQGAYVPCRPSSQAALRRCLISTRALTVSRADTW